MATKRCASAFSVEAHAELACASDVVQHEPVVKQHRAKQLRFRPAGAPAGAWEHTPWWHCVFFDPYERVNVWSHGVPGLLFAILAATVDYWVPEAAQPLRLFAACAAMTQLLSALTHVYPDSHTIEKLDHLGIVLLIIGTPLTALMAKEHGHVPLPMQVAAVIMTAAAFLPPLPRVLAFASGVVSIVYMYATIIINRNLAVQLVLYGIGGITFLRNGGHTRCVGFSDHHILHYVVTIACSLHVFYIVTAMHEPAVPL